MPMKTKIYLAGGVCAASLALCVPLNAQVTPATTASPATAPEATASPAAKAARPLPFHGKITGVDQNLKTFNIGAKQIFKITDTTVITKGGAPATMTDIVENEQARGSYLKQADGTLEAKSVKIGPKAEGEKKARKSKKRAGAAEGSPAASPTP
jgi:hypothetical protein